MFCYFASNIYTFYAEHKVGTAIADKGRIEKAGTGDKHALSSGYVIKNARALNKLPSKMKEYGAMARKETGLLGRMFNALTGTGTTITRTRDFWGNKKTIVHNYDTGTTKEYTHNQGFFSNRTDVKVSRNGREIARGNIKRDFWGLGVETMEHSGGRVRKTVKKMDLGFWGNRDQTTLYDASGREIGRKNGRAGLIFDSYTREYTGTCWCCDGTGIYKPTGKTCRKCGGTGTYRKKKSR